MATPVYMRDALRDDAREEPEDWLRAPAPFAVRMSRGRWQTARHHELISNEIAKIEHGPIFLMVNEPPRHGKSKLISQWTPVWFLRRWPWKNVILASYQTGYASTWGGMARDSVIENAQELGLRISRSTQAKAEWTLAGYGGGMKSTGVGGSITGRGGDLLIIDDPIKNFKEAMSAVYRENVKEWYRSTLRTRLEPGGSIIILMTRWHDDDLCGWLLSGLREMAKEAAEEIEGEPVIETETAPEDIPLDPWRVINLKAIADPTPTDPDPLGRAPGEPLWPERWSLRELLRLKNSVGSFWWPAEYQGSPRPEGGGIFKEGNFQYFNPDEFADLRLSRYIQIWDTGYEQAQVNDYSVCITMAVNRRGYYILDMWRGRPDFPDLENAVKAQYAKWVPDRIIIEKAASGRSILQQLRRDSKLPITAVKAVDSKEVRAHSVTGIVEAGRVFLPERAMWVHEFITEVCGFPAAAHDDIVDAFVHGLMYYKPKRKPGGRRSMTETAPSKWSGVG